MRLRSPMFAFGVAALLLVDLAGCDSNPTGPTAPSAPSSPSTSPGADTKPEVTAKGRKKEPGQKAKNALSSAAGTQ